MAEANSTARPRPRKAAKPKKPSKDFPLFPHANGQWAKKVRQKLHFFGVWADHQKALLRWLDEKDDLLAGRVPRSRHPDDTQTLRELANQFLATKESLRDNGELSPYTWQAYHDVCRELIDTFGRDRLLTDILPADFESLRTRWAKKWGAQRLATEINRARTVFNFAYKNGLLDRPMRYGEGFRRPSKKVMRLNKAKKGKMMFNPDELYRMIGAATQPLKTMLLLAINAALGNNDIAQLPLAVVDDDGEQASKTNTETPETTIDLKRGWLTYPRPKTGITRECPLWPETVAALKEWITMRPTPKNEKSAGLFFLTVRGDGWGNDIKDRPITHACRKLLDNLAIAGKRNFYAIRHTFKTVGDQSKDKVAVDAIMGHDDGSAGNVYLEEIWEQRLLAVTNFVREWLFKNNP